MKRTIASLGLVVLVMVPQLVAAQEGEEALTNEDIVALTEAVLPMSVIVAKIAATRSDFDTTVEQLVALAGAGVEVARGYDQGGICRKLATGGADAPCGSAAHGGALSRKQKFLLDRPRRAREHLASAPVDLSCRVVRSGARAWPSPERVLRGGFWNNNPRNLRAANRNRNTTGNRNDNNGFRVARTLSSWNRRRYGAAGRAVSVQGGS